MNKTLFNVAFSRFTALILLFLFNSISLFATDPPFIVKDNLFDESNIDSLGLTTPKGIETVTVFSPVETTDKFSNGVVMTAFKDYLYCQWQSSAKDEDAQDTWVAYSRSKDGINWTEPMVIAPSIDNGYCSSGGWWVAGDTLVAYINVWPSNVSPRGGFTYYTSSVDGITWHEKRPVLMASGDTLKGIFEQDPHALPDGRIVNAVHFQPGLIISPVYTDDPSGIRGWIRSNFTNLKIDGGISREIEPSWYLRSDDTLVMVFRDQDGTFKKLASVSGDRGESWTEAVLTNMPDSRAKQSAGNISDSIAFFVSNPVNNKTRLPLAITLSPDGKFFDTAYVLRKAGAGIQELRFAGTAKRSGYHYPKSMIWKDTLYVSYATNKEDVEYTRVPTASLVVDSFMTNPDLPDIVNLSNEAEGIEIEISKDKLVQIKMKDILIQNTVRIFNVSGAVVYSGSMQNDRLTIDMKSYSSGLYIVDVHTPKGTKTKRISNF